MKMKMKLTLAASLVASSFAFSAHAGIVTNDTDLLTGTGHAQLSEWLGVDFDLTRIFAKGVDGTSSQDWHQHVDGKGSTFTVFEIFNGSDRMVVGGYNNFNWSSGDGWLINTDRSNFLFNLSTGVHYKKNDNTNFQTNNHDFYGAAFGAGFDLMVRQDLSSGYANIGHSYGDRSKYGDANYRESFVGTSDYFNVGYYETYTMSNSTGIFGSGANALLAENGELNNVPVPFALAGVSLLGLGFTRRKKTI